MQTIQIEKLLYEKLISAGIDIQNELQKIVDGFTSYDKKPLLSKEEIQKVVENSQRIEGYEPVSSVVKKRVKVLMQKHNVKVSFES